MIFLDTDIVVDVVRKVPPAVTWLNQVSNEVLAVSGSTVVELLAGCRNALEQQKLDRETALFQVVWLQGSRCDVALRNYRDLRLSHGIGVFDVFIGRTAIELGVPLHTFNAKHFQSTCPD